MIDRRNFLAGSGAFAALPALPSLGTPSLGTPPRRNNVRGVWIYFPNGVSEEAWHPKRIGRDGRLERLNPVMAPLEPLRDELLMFERLHTPEGNGHGAGTATWLTGGDWHERELSAGGPSVDQIAARKLGRNRVAPSLSLSTRGEGFFATDVPRNHISWHSAKRPVFRETDPRAVFGRLFGAGPETDKSVLDRMRNQARALRKRLGREDQEKLDEYLDSIRAVERRIAFAGQPATARRLAEAKRFGLGAPDAKWPTDHKAYVDAMFDLLALALWTGATPVATFMLDHGQSNRYCPFVPNVQGTWHALSHWKDASGKTEDDDGKTKWGSVREKRAMYDRVVRWHHERVARFLKRLKSLPDGAGSLLDQCLVVYGSSIADGHEHGEEDIPVLVAGRAGGAVRPGRVLEARREVSLSKLHLASLHALGVPAEEFADADRALRLR